MNSTPLSGSVDRHSDLRQRERRLCTCGLIATGYMATWEISHTTSCPAALLFTTSAIVRRATER